MENTINSSENKSFSLAALLSATYHSMLGQIVNRLNDEGHQDLTQRQLYLLSQMSGKETTVKDLAVKIHMPEQIVSNLTHMMSETSYLTVSPPTEEVPEGVVRVGERGRAALLILAEVQDTIEQHWAESMGWEDFEKLRKLLEDLYTQGLHHG